MKTSERRHYWLPGGVLIDTPGVHNDVERGEYALAHGGSVDALVLTTTGQLYLYLDPYTPTQCPEHVRAGREPGLTVVPCW
ncbi:hypothetical protein FHR84_000379 [Actinopolyspora biskrensis]|uniref:Uncharacterized protein n=1 Tax=Actinopolyspora biskrensis TaxID=1470178 RepID=A0A852YW09_9ACTN|nr:hypothetical protein [Actinopolyspora biskrensis]NYH77065.1 hypothetical protein [Actinopolyspora biskrensis]